MLREIFAGRVEARGNCSAEMLKASNCTVYGSILASARIQAQDPAPRSAIRQVGVAEARTKGWRRYPKFLFLCHC